MDRNGTVLSMTKEGSIYADDFLDFVSSLAVLHPPGRMFVFDNCRIHMQAAVRACLHAHGHQAVYLPSYSPFLNPIEFFFSELKGALAGSHRRELLRGHHCFCACMCGGGRRAHRPRHRWLARSR